MVSSCKLQRLTSHVGRHCAISNARPFKYGNLGTARIHRHHIAHAFPGRNGDVVPAGISIDKEDIGASHLAALT